MDSQAFSLECLDCHSRFPLAPARPDCPQCGGQWHAARYDLSAAARSLRAKLPSRPFDLWRYLELLPISEPDPVLRRGEGGTPLLAAPNLGAMLGLPRLLVKDETRGPTGSIKDRQAALSLAVLRAHGIHEAVVSSTGNVAISYSAYAARAGIRLWAFLTSLVPADKMNEVALYGTHVVKVTGTYDQAKRLAAEFARSHGMFYERGPRGIAAVESMKTLAFEIAEQLGDGPGVWGAPDWYVQAVSSGIGPLGVAKGFRELRGMGWVDRMPSLAVIQAAGCSPMVEAWRKGEAEATPVLTPSTHISTLTSGDPGRAYAVLREAALESGGVFESVTDEEAFRAMRILAKMEGLSVEPAAAAAFAGAIKLAQAGVFRPDDVVVVNSSGHTLPIENDLVGEARLQDVALPEPPAQPPAEGLVAALSSLDPRRTRHILVVDDDPASRRLIRRILMSQGDFRLHEVGSGAEALAEAQRNPPDLILLDLMMPEMDGFRVLSQLKGHEHTAATPVIVVTAKGLSPAERRMVEGLISRLVVKGDLVATDLLEEVRRSLP